MINATSVSPKIALAVFLTVSGCALAENSPVRNKAEQRPPFVRAFASSLVSAEEGFSEKDLQTMVGCLCKSLDESYQIISSNDIRLETLQSHPFEAISTNLKQAIQELAQVLYSSEPPEYVFNFIDLITKAQAKAERNAALADMKSGRATPHSRPAGRVDRRRPTYLNQDLLETVAANTELRYIEMASRKNNA